MKNVKVIASIIVLFTLFFSCKPIHSKKDTTKKTDTIKQNKMVEKKDTSKRYPYIETNSLKDSFIWDLINTLPVKEKDTVLFRKWDAIDIDSIYLVHKKTQFKIKNSRYEYFYKTGNKKFSTYKITIKNTVTNKHINIYTYLNYGNKSGDDPYSMNNIGASLGLKKESTILGRFEISNPHSLGNYIYFTVNENGINIIKLEYIVNTKKRAPDFSYILDTLITIDKNNKFINITKLNDILGSEKNIRRH